MSDTNTYDLRSRSIYKFDIRKQNKKNDQAAGENNNNGKKKKTGGKCPPPLSPSEDDEGQSRDAAEPALQHYNHHIAANDGGIIYEMVDWGLSTAFMKPMENGSKCHSNFTAKPLGSNDDSPPMLFFAEVWRDTDLDTPPVVLKCQRLGPQGQVFTGHNGCRACKPDSSESIHHPPDGNFDVGCTPYLL